MRTLSGFRAGNIKLIDIVLWIAREKIGISIGLPVPLWQIGLANLYKKLEISRRRVILLLLLHSVLWLCVVTYNDILTLTGEGVHTTL